MICKHRVNLILGLDLGVVSGNESQVNLVKEAYKNSKVIEYLNLQKSKEDDLKKIQEEIKDLKKAIALKLRKVS
jgi:hypothetical protein